MIIKTGVDIIEVERIKKNIEKYNEVFLNKIYTKKEIEYCESKKVQKYQSYAARFAAKEAVLKAISDFLESKFDIEWKDIEVSNDSNGRPIVNLTEGLLEKIYSGNSFAFDKELGISIDISISHTYDMAIASVVFMIG